MATFGKCSACQRQGRLARGWCLTHYARWRRYGDPHRGGEIAVYQVRPLVLKSDHALIPLSQGLFASIDLEDIDRIGTCNWHAVRDNCTFYAFSGNKVGLHNVIMSNNDGTQIVDHKDGDGLNNRRSNLRFATKSQNQFNKRINKNNSSGYKGVRFASWAGGENKWRASIFTDGKHKSLGYFLTPEMAAAAYDEAAIEIFGKFARLNSEMVGG